MATVFKPTKNLLMTGEEFARTEIAERCELVRGRIVPMPPPNYDHSSIEANITGHLFMYLQKHKLGRLGSDGGLYTGFNPDTVRGADITFTSNERLAKRDTTKIYLDVPPDWIIEIFSPSNTETYNQEKLGEYFNINVRLVWLVDPEARCVNVYRSLTDMTTFGEQDTITGADVLPDFSIQVAKFFENV